jgi:hypothetical protein
MPRSRSFWVDRDCSPSQISKDCTGGGLSGAIALC